MKESAFWKNKRRGSFAGRRSPLFSVFASVLLLSACAVSAPPENAAAENDFRAKVAGLAESIRPEGAAAVSFIYDTRSGDVTELGNEYRDKVQLALRGEGVDIKARRDLGMIMDDVESHGFRKSERQMWEDAGADVVIGGRYRTVSSSISGEKTDRIYIVVTAYRVADSSNVGGFSHWDDCPPGWISLQMVKHGNVWHDKYTSVFDAKAPEDGPKLTARWDKKPACYLHGESARITVETEPGVYLYLINLAADYTAALWYPNSKLEDRKWRSGRFVFPPPSLGDDMVLELLMTNGKPVVEQVKVVAGRTPLDFSKIPVAENKECVGEDGGEMKQMLQVLERASGWSQFDLEYAVSPDCGD